MVCEMQTTSTDAVRRSSYYSMIFRCLIVLASITAALAQSISPAFEVASIKPNKSGIRGGSVDFPEGGERFTATNMPLGGLILTAYNVTVRRLSGPDAIGEKYDIEAKAERSVSRNELRRMLQTLLSDRFKLVLRKETKEIPVYALIVARSGVKLHPSSPSGDRADSSRTGSGPGGIEPKSGHLIFRGESMSEFAWALSRITDIGDRVVIDDTGLRGNYDFELTFERGVVPDAGADVREARPDGPSIFTALQEQLGLRWQEPDQWNS
jgi:uncharacterized protein (TIGR03435 family)